MSSGGGRGGNRRFLTFQQERYEWTDGWMDGPMDEVMERRKDGQCEGATQNAL